MNIRPYKQADQEKIKALAERFLEFELLPHRDSEQMYEKQIELTEAAFKNASNLFIAEQDQQFLGYIELAEQRDFFTNESVAYISAIAVTPEGQGSGVGKQLMKKAEEWCIERGNSQLVLDVFKANEGAVQFYKHLGFDEEIVKMVKSLK
ncbi:GNAT family N-acetyltransferase [Geomicrobium sp. JCM 19038]|uniref:GNAT family N-acetyltransferase n=1 Tax=Geomicrobium sp. JCM 19038 TaxID=1460635 RepID=UPI00045F19A6|nr:GNAT family N-acetyltransferase [Geomicrobium sp. JCM 19038]GAK08098.1 ribosomal-protein-alanine acetyltransferase [Geomicrobium sp. JCM 19038]